MSTNPRDTVVITGAASGLGEAMAVCCAQRGYDLALVDINKEGLEETFAALQNTGAFITIHTTDVSNEEAVILLRDEILVRHRNILWLVNNAAVSISDSFEQLEIQRFRNLFEVNFWGYVYTCKYFLPHLKQSKNARIVNVISGFALMGFPGKTSYGSSKAAVMGFSSSLKTELQRSSVKVCVVIPPPLDTNLVRNSGDTNTDQKTEEIAFLEKHGMPVAVAAKQIVERIELGKFRIIVGAATYWADVVARVFPTLLQRIIGQNKKLRSGFGKQ